MGLEATSVASPLRPRFARGYDWLRQVDAEGSAKGMDVEQKYFVYILRSLKDPKKTYVGFTTRLEERLAEHNEESQVYSRRYAPWERITYVAFSDTQTALEFECYLKSSSGKAFAQKHLV